VLAVVIAGFLHSQGGHHETDLPTVEHQAQTDARIPGEDEDPRRARRNPRTSRQRPRTSGRLNSGNTRFSFSRARRLHGPHAYAAVFAFKCWVNGRWFQVYARPSGAERARLGVVVSKRVMKMAVARNYYKRLARDVFRHEYARLPGMDFVVRPREQIDSACSVLARTEMMELLQRAASQCRNKRLAATNR
jgi:ribonuclease P protein component